MAVNSSIYPYDPIGNNPDCKIISERHNVQPPANITDASLFFLKAAPAYASSIVIRTGLAPNAPVLVEGQDYILTHKFLFKSWELTKPIYGSITLQNRDYTGDLYVDYQTLGGAFVLDDISMVENLSRTIYRTRYIYWEQVAGIIPGLPPFDHSMSGTDTVGWGEVVDAVLRLSAAIIDVSGGGGSGGGASLLQHINSTTAHQLKNVGGSNLFNYPLAALNDFDGTGSANKYVNPQIIVAWVKNYIVSLGLNNISTTITTMQQAINTINQTIQQMQSNASTQEQLMTDLAERMDTMEETVDSLEQNVATSIAPIAGMQEDIADIKNQLGTVGPSDISTRVGNLEQSVSIAANDIADIKQDILDHETRITDLEAGLTNPDLGDIPTRLTTAESGLIAINGEITTIKNRVKNLELGFDKGLINFLITETTKIVVEPNVVVSFVAVPTCSKNLLIEVLEVGTVPVSIACVSDTVISHATKLTAVTETSGVIDGTGWELVTGQLYGGVAAGSTGSTSSGKLEATYTNETTENAELMFTFNKALEITDLDAVPGPGAVLVTVTYP